MEESPTISAKSSPNASMNFEFLREEGLKFIKELAGKVWTDHNIHDPGITILESLCYAITELGFRTNQDMEDILQSSTKSTEEAPWKQFFTAAEILPNAPLTILDYRKLIIDLPFVRNCWVIKSKDTEIEPYLEPKDLQCPNSINRDPEYTEALQLRGLFDVLVEFEIDDLNDFEIPFSFIDPNGVSRSGVIAFPHWDEIFGKWPDGNPSMFQARVINSHTVRKDDQSIIGFYLELVIKREDWEVCVYLEVNLDESLPSEANVELWSGSIKSWFEGEEGSQTIGDYHQRLQIAFSQIRDIRELLHENRNLCEDFKRIRGTRVQKIAVEATIQTRHLYQRESILAEIYCKVHEYLSPKIKFKTLSELLEEKKDPDEIFRGPLLQNGFIDSSDLASFKDREVIYTSDLVRLLMGVEEVVGVSDIRVSNYVRNEFIRKAEDCLQLNTEIYKPKLSVDLSRITFTPDYPVDQQKLKDLLAEKIMDYDRIPSAIDLPIPAGEDLDVEHYYSVQNDYPQVYGIGFEGLNSSESQRRKAQALQLKSYLLFFEQLLANFLSQLQQVKHLLSMSPRINRTYFFQPLYDIPNISSILSNQTEDWEDFINNDQNHYIQHLEEIIEDKDGFLDRRNRFLDHLIGRFSEDFTEYALTMLNKDEGYHSNLIHDKVDFLNNYDDFSPNRGLGFNYKRRDTLGIPDIWDSENISGIEKRVYAKLGIDNHIRRRIFSDKKVEDHFQVYEVLNEDGERVFGFRLMKEHQVLLSSTNTFYSRKELRNGIDQFVRCGIHNYNYRCSIANNGKYFFTLVDFQNIVIAKRIEFFETEGDIDKEITKIISMLRDEFWMERFYLLENILLRPKIETDLSKSDIVQTLSAFEGVSITLRDPDDLPDNIGERLLDHFVVYKYDIADGEVPRHAYGFKVYDLDGNLRLVNIAPIYSVYELRQLLNDVARFGIQKGRYYKKTDLTGDPKKYWYELMGWYDQPIAQSNEIFGSSRARSNAINRSVSIFQNFDEDEITIRDHWLTFPTGSPSVLQKDPFSFRAIAVFPRNTGRFKDPLFCALALRKLQEEIPAHIVLEVIWAHEYDFYQFERAYRHWLIENSKDPPIEDQARLQYDFDLHVSHRKLLDIIAMIRCNSGISEGIDEKTDGMMITPDDGDEAVHFWNDLIVTNPHDSWVVGEMTIGKEFVVGMTCDYNDVIGEMIVGQDFKIAYSFFQKYEAGVGYGSVGRNFYIDP